MADRGDSMIPANSYNLFDNVRQVSITLRHTQRDIHNHVRSWKNAARASTPIPVISDVISAANKTFGENLAWISTLKSDKQNWPKIAAIFLVLGATDTDFHAVFDPLLDAVHQISAMDKSSYAAIISACDQILATINAPLSLWPE